MIEDTFSRILLEMKVAKDSTGQVDVLVLQRWHYELERLHWTVTAALMEAGKT